MARYRKIDTRIWNDQKFNALSNDGKLFFLFLLTHPSMTAIGAMRASLSGLASELGWDIKTLQKAFQEVFVKGMVEHDEKASFVSLPNFMKYNKPESPNVVKSWEQSLDYLPECKLKSRLIQYVKAFVEGLPKAFADALPEPFRKGMSNQEQEQEQEQDLKEKPTKEIFSGQAQPRDHDKTQKIFDYWKTTLNHPNAKLDRKRSAVIRKALTSGYSVEQLCDAIKGCSLTPHNMGYNERNQRYDGLGVIFKDADNIDRFIRNAHSPPCMPTHASSKTQNKTMRLMHDNFDNKHYTQTPAENIAWLQKKTDNTAM